MTTGCARAMAAARDPAAGALRHDPGLKLGRAVRSCLAFLRGGIGTPVIRVIPVDLA